MLLRSSGRAGTVGSSQIAVVGELGPGPNSSSVLSRTLRKGKVIDGYWCALEWFLQQSGIVSWIVRALNFCIVAFWWVSRPCYICSGVLKQIELETWVVHSHATCQLQYQIFWWPKHFDLLFLWTHIIIRIWTARCIINCINYDLNFLKPLDGQTPAVCSDCRQDVEVGFRDHVAFGWHGQISGKGTTCPVQICQYAWCCVLKNVWSGRAQGVGIHGDDGRPRSPWSRICVASPYLMMIDYCLIAKWKHHQHIIWCSLFDL